MEWCKLGQSDAVRARRFDVLRLEETGLKPSEIRGALDEKLYPGIKIGKIYEDLKWARRHIDREAREDIFDKHIMRQITDKLSTITNPLVRVSYLKLLFNVRQDQRKRAGLYIEKIELKADINISEEMRIIKEVIHEFLTVDAKSALAEKLEEAKKEKLKAGLN